MCVSTSICSLMTILFLFIIVDCSDALFYFSPKTGEVGTCEVALDGQEKQVPHQAGPTGDEYAVVEKTTTRRAAPSTPQFEAMTYQDPSTIQRQEAPTGDLYALPNKDPKESKEPMPVYSEVNKVRGGGCC